MESSKELERHAIPFIECDDNGVFSVNTDAMALLEEQQKKKLAVVAIAGPYRSGKSFLANRFLNKMKGFEIGSTVQSCTRGIWMWNKPIHLNEDVDAILLDTEGLNSTDRFVDVDAKIFALSILLSSSFVFNQIGHITEQSIEDLSVVLRLTNEMKIRDGTSEETGLEFKQFFPQFIWVLRDFSLNFQHLTPKSYLEQCLENSKGMSDDVFQKNSIRQSIKNFFSDLDCFTLVRPVNNEAQLAHIEDMNYNDLRVEFRNSVDQLMQKLKNNPRVKTINNKALSGSMLLGLALEYVEALNNKEIPVVLSSFERVVQVESRRFTEKLFEEVTNKIRQQCDEQLMPFEEEDLQQIYSDLIEYSNRRISDKLSEIASVDNILELRQDFEKRIRSYYKQIEETNIIESRTFCLNLLHNLTAAKIHEPKISDIQDIPPNLMNQMKNQYTELIIEYQKTARGPYKSEALSEIFQQKVLDDMTNLIKDIEQAYTNTFNKVKLMISDCTRQESKYKSLIDQSSQTLQQLELEKEGLQQEKTQLELEIDDLLRQIKGKEDEKQNILNLKMIELNNLKQNNEKKLQEKTSYIKQISGEVEQLKDQITKNQEAILSLQKTKLKDVSQLKNQHKIMKESLEHSKKKLQENAELMAVNTLFKKLKVNFDEIKVMISELQEMQTVKNDFFQLQKEIQEREFKIASQEYRLRLKFDCDVEEQVIKQRKNIDDLEKERLQIEKDMFAIEDAIAVIQNEHQYLTLKLENIKKENKLVEDNLFYYKQQERHQDSFVRTLQGKVKEEQERQEELEVQQYEQSVRMATLMEDSDKILQFLEEFIKRQTTGKAKDNTMFKELSESDKESVNEMLKSFGIQYKDAF